MPPIILEEASNGTFPELDPVILGRGKVLRTSRTYALTINGTDYRDLERLAKGYGSVGELLRDVIQDYLRLEKWGSHLPAISEAAIEAQEQELTGRLPL